jgi:tight adherence protein B
VNEQLLTILLSGMSATLLVLGVWQVIKNMTKGERRRLKKRLVHRGENTAMSELPRSITMKIKGGGFSRWAVQYQVMRKIYKLLHQANPDATLGRFVSICAFMAGAAFIAVTILTGNVGGALCAGLIGAVLPFWFICNARRRRFAKIQKQLPEGLEFMSRVLRAGHSLSMALKMMGEELAEPLSGEFRRCYDQHSLGQALEDGLKDITARVESPDLAFLVTAILIQRQTGGDLSVVLNNISEMIRQRVRLTQQVRAKTAEGRFTGYILVAFPVAMFFLTYFLNPKYSETLLYTGSGRMLLGVAIMLEVIGLFAIRKVTQVRV